MVSINKASKTALVKISQNLADEQKAIAEFWEDGRGTYYPPGHWLEFGLEIAQRDNQSLDEDILLFFPLGNALFDAGVATWEAKLNYDYARPVRVIRELARLGLMDESQINFLTYQDPQANPSPPFPEYTSGHSAFSAAGAEVLRLFTEGNLYGNILGGQVGLDTWHQSQYYLNGGAVIPEPKTIGASLLLIIGIFSRKFGYDLA